MIEAILSAIDDDKQRNELSEFYKQYKKRFFNIAYSKLHNTEEAEDAIQEAFLRIINVSHKFFGLTGIERVRFVDGIVRHISIDKYNKRTTIRGVSIDEIDENIPSDVISPEEKYITNVSAEELVQFILTLPENQRIALLLYVHYKLSYSEISKLLDISEELARKRVSNARKAIRTFAEENNQ